MISNDPDVSAAVVDASVWCDALLPGSRRDAARAALEPYTVVIAPEHTLLEIAQVLRRYARTDLGNVRATAIVVAVGPPFAAERAGLLDGRHAARQPRECVGACAHGRGRLGQA